MRSAEGGREARAARPCSLLAAALLLAACGSSEFEPGASEPPPPPVETVPTYFGRPSVVVVTIDTLRADHLGCYGYFRDTTPNLDAFAREAILFERCLAPMATTLPVHTSLFTGVWPAEHGVLANIKEGRERYEPTVHLARAAQIFEGSRYASGAFVSALPLKRKFGLKYGFEHYDNPSAPTRLGGETVDLALEWLGEQKDRPFFLWVHLFDPHSPYEAPEPYGSMFTDSEELERWIEPRQYSEVATRPTGQENELRSGINAYDGEVRYSDEQVGRIFDALRARPEWDELIVLVLADHGEGLNQHGEPGHGLSWDEQLRVPCLLRLPGVAPTRYSGTIAVVDLFPTILSRLDLHAAPRYLEQASGIDVLAEGFEPRPVFGMSSERQERFGGEPTYSLTTDRWKSIVSENGPELLFDLQADPHELADLAGHRPDVLAKMKRHTFELLEAMQARGASLEAGRLVPLEADEAAGLRTLGYLGDDE